jgi:hypothetical protein
VAPVKLHEALLQPFQFTGVDCTHTQSMRTRSVDKDEGVKCIDEQLERFSMSSINCDAGNAHCCQLEHLILGERGWRARRYERD